METHHSRDSKQRARAQRTRANECPAARASSLCRCPSSRRKTAHKSPSSSHKTRDIHRGCVKMPVFLLHGQIFCTERDGGKRETSGCGEGVTSLQSHSYIPPLGPHLHRTVAPWLKRWEVLRVWWFTRKHCEDSERGSRRRKSKCSGVQCAWGHRLLSAVPKEMEVQIFFFFLCFPSFCQGGGKKKSLHPTMLSGDVSQS